MLYVSILTSDRERDPELWTTIWQAKAPPTLKLIGLYNLAGTQRLIIWEGESARDLQFMDNFNYVGELETFPAFDRTTGWQAAFAGDLDAFTAIVTARGVTPRSEAAIDLRRRGLEAPNGYAARRAALDWMEEQEMVGEED
jgi:hypothetical protein